MTKAGKKKLPPDTTARAGTLLRGFAENQVLNGVSRPETMQVVARRALELAAEDLRNCRSDQGLRRVMAAQQAAQALLAAAEGRDQSGLQRAFDQLVENHEGGPREFDLGGPSIGNKKSVKEDWLRAAAVVIWKQRPDLRDTLVKDSKALLGVHDRAALRKLIDNVGQGRLEPVSAHIPLVRKLMELGWTRLSDFC